TGLECQMPSPRECWYQRLSRPTRLRIPVRVPVRVVGQQQDGDEADGPAPENIEGDRRARLKRREQRGCDEWRGTAGDDRSKLVAQRGAAVTQAGREWHVARP